jgi:hypothetical protein
MTNAARLSLLFLVSSTAACSGGGGGGGGNEGDFGQYELASLDEDCEGIAGLRGRVALQAANAPYDAELGYITANAQRIDLTPLTIDLTIPATPTVLCYPEHTTENGVVATPRVAVTGVEMIFATDDGKFDESLDAKLWSTTANGFIQPPMALAVTTRGQLNGSWEPFEDYEPIEKNMSFMTGLTGSSSTFTAGLVGCGHDDRKEYNAAIFDVPGQFAMATW